MTCRPPRSLLSSRRSCRDDRDHRVHAWSLQRDAAMSSCTAFNLILAVVLLAANAFYVAAEFALVKSKGFRIDALAERTALARGCAGHPGQHRGLSRLLPARHHHGLARPRMGRRADCRRHCRAVATPLGMPESAVHLTSFLVGFLVFSSLHIVSASRCRRRLPSVSRSRFPSGSPSRSTSRFCLFYPLNWLLNKRHARSWPFSASANPRIRKFSPTSRSKASSRFPPSTAKWRKARPSISTICSGSANWKSPT